MCEIKNKLEKIVKKIDWPLEERDQMIELLSLFAQKEDPPDPYGLFPAYKSHLEKFTETIIREDHENIEEAFLNLYCHLHGSNAPYTARERAKVDETGGYGCYVGGISPLLKAKTFIRSETVSADFGAGNGLQGLLLQRLYPHKKTIQIEISGKMVETGMLLQKWLGISENRVEWRNSDLLDESPKGIDFIYIYRPLKPEGIGHTFYTEFSKKLGRQNTVIFSVADCLEPFLDPAFIKFYSDGHLTCYKN